jgi:inositol phosphorylceramide mannosyltransferase catalytic subunit
MSLSVCLISVDPPARLETVLEPLRPYAQEILIAVDAHLDEGALAGHDGLADRILEIDVRSHQQHLDWLQRQCTGDWVLRLDSSELVSRAFLRRLPEMLSSQAVRQFWVLRRWLFGQERNYLDEHPWSVDFVSRLMRNDGTPPTPSLTPPCAGSSVPHEYVTEPFYNLELLLEDGQQRRDEVIRSEIIRPRLKAVGGGRLHEAFYLPELHKSLHLKPVPEEDRAAIAHVHVGSEVVTPTHRNKSSVVAFAEVDRPLSKQAVQDNPSRTSIETYETAVSFAPAETRAVFFYVTNQETERWPANLNESPQIRLGYRWLHADGTLLEETGPRSPFPRPVEPGDRVLAAVHAQAPAQIGDYLLEVDIVHEHIRWFECQARLPARVIDPGDLPQGITPLYETNRPIAQHLHRLRIPRTIHRVWLGGHPMPEREARFGESFAQHNPGWTMRLWTDEDLPTLDIGESERERSRSASELSNLVRYEVLHRYGGVYVDTDFECLRPLTPILRGIDAFTALESPGRTAVGILGCVAGHPLFGRAARLTRQTLGTGAHSADANGPYFFSLLLEQGHDLAIFDAGSFYPYSWDETVSPGTTFPNAYAVHHWAKSWMDEERNS